MQAREDFSPAGRWYWDERSGQVNAPAAWQQPANGGGHNCLTWTVKASCNAGSVWPDQVFRLLGTVGSPTAVRFASLSARRLATGVAISWRSGPEATVLGFNVWRRVGATTWAKVNRGLIPAHPLGGASYTYVDRTALASVRYLFRLDAVYLGGTVAPSAVIVVARR